MSKQDRLKSDLALIEPILRKTQVCRLGMTDGKMPYVIPLCFGYQDQVLYFHTGICGKKLDILRQNPNVCFEIDEDCQIIEGEMACKWSMKFRSVVGYGKAFLIHTSDEKRAALDVIMRQYSDKAWSYPDEKLTITTIIQLEIESMTALVHGYDL